MKLTGSQGTYAYIHIRLTYPNMTTTVAMDTSPWAAPSLWRWVPLFPTATLVLVSLPLIEITLSFPCLTYKPGAIDSHESEVNVASDFMALYTTRQKYRRPDISLLDSADGQVLGIGGELHNSTPIYDYIDPPH